MIQNQEQGGVPGGSPANQKKFPWMMVLGGCGCLTVLLVIGLGVGGYFMYGKAKTSFGELMEDYDITSMIDDDDGKGSGKSKSSKSSKSKSSKSNSKSKSAREKLAVAKDQKDALSPEKIRGYMLKPLTKADIQEVNKSATAWKKNKAYIEYEKNSKAVENSMAKDDGKMSTVETMRAVRNATKTVSSMAKLGEAYEVHVEKYGGLDAHYSRVIRISGIIAATEIMAEQHDLEDKHSNEAIKHVQKEQPEIAAEYKKGIAEAKAAAARGDEVGMESYAAVFGGGPGAIAMARMPASTFKMWQSLSVAQRKQAEEDLTGALGASSFFGVGLHPTLLFQTAIMGEFEEIGGKQ